MYWYYYNENVQRPRNIMLCWARTPVLPRVIHNVEITVSSDGVLGWGREAEVAHSGDGLMIWGELQAWNLECERVNNEIGNNEGKTWGRPKAEQQKTRNEDEQENKGFFVTLTFITTNFWTIQEKKWHLPQSMQIRHSLSWKLPYITLTVYCCYD